MLCNADRMIHVYTYTYISPYTYLSMYASCIVLIIHTTSTELQLPRQFRCSLRFSPPQLTSTSCLLHTYFDTLLRMSQHRPDNSRYPAGSSYRPHHPRYDDRDGAMYDDRSRSASSAYSPNSRPRSPIDRGYVSPGGIRSSLHGERYASA